MSRAPKEGISNSGKEVRAQVQYMMRFLYKGRADVIGELTEISKAKVSTRNNTIGKPVYYSDLETFLESRTQEFAVIVSVTKDRFRSYYKGDLVLSSRDLNSCDFSLVLGTCLAEKSFNLYIECDNLSRRGKNRLLEILTEIKHCFDKRVCVILVSGSGLTSNPEIEQMSECEIGQSEPVNKKLKSGDEVFSAPFCPTIKESKKNEDEQSQISKEDLNEKIEGLENERLILQKDNECLQSKYHCLEVDYQSLQTNFESLVKDQELLQKKFEDKREGHPGLMTEHERLKTSHDGLRNDYDSVKNDNDSLVRELESLKKDREHLIRDHYSLKIEHDDLEREHGSLEGKHDSLEKDLGSSTREHESLKKDHDQLKIDYDNLEKRYESLKKDHNSLESKHDGFKKDHDSLVSEYDSLRKDYDSLEREHASLKEEFNSLENHHQGLQKQYDMLKNSHAHLKDGQSAKIKILRDIIDVNQKKLTRASAPEIVKTSIPDLHFRKEITKTEEGQVIFSVKILKGEIIQDFAELKEFSGKGASFKLAKINAFEMFIKNVENYNL